LDVSGEESSRSEVPEATVERKFPSRPDSSAVISWSVSWAIGCGLSVLEGLEVLQSRERTEALEVRILTAAFCQIISLQTYIK
jgi:hypothetical protein